MPVKMTKAEMQERANLWLAICLLFNGGEEKLKALLHQIAKDVS